MTNGKILSTEQCDEILSSLQSFDTNIEEYCNQLIQAINIFNNNETVQSFYASGGLGRGMQDQLQKVLDTVRRYYEVISSEGGLIPTTRLIVAEQMEILNSRSNGGA